VLNFKAFSRVYYAVALVIVLVLGGSFGFMLIEDDWSLMDAFYMTIITVSTVGFGEVKTLSDGGRLFTALLIISSIGTFTYSVSAITTYFVAGEYIDIFRKTKVGKKISDLRGHTIVCGYGRVGRKACLELLSHGEKFVVIENDDERVDQIVGDGQYLAIKGDATLDDVLKDAGIEHAKSLIATLPNDADNLYVVLAAREANATITIISRASRQQSLKKLRIAGADNVIMPDHVGGSHMASLVVNPDVMEFLDHIKIQGSGDINLEEVAFSDLRPELQHKTLGELELRNKLGINIIGVKNANGEFVINPGPETKILPNSKFFVLGKRDQIKLLNRVLGIHQSSS
jgi:voltage-gated potassium channel